VADDYEVFHSWVKRRVIAMALTEYTLICSIKKSAKGSYTKTFNQNRVNKNRSYFYWLFKKE